MTCKNAYTGNFTKLMTSKIYKKKVCFCDDLFLENGICYCSTFSLCSIISSGCFLQVGGTYVA